MNFWNGFIKQAAKEPKEPQAPPSGQNMLKWDAQGGVAPRTPEAMQAAQGSNMLTLPTNVPGANCGNCMNVRVIDTKEGTGYCTLLNQDVTDKMHCAQWDAPGVLRSYEVADAAEAPPSPADDIAQDFQQGAVDPQTGQPAEGGEPAAKPKAKPKKKDGDKSKGDKPSHTINVNVGKGGK